MSKMLSFLIELMAELLPRIVDELNRPHENPNTPHNSSQLQNHPKFITVHGRWVLGKPHDPRTRGHGLGVILQKLLLLEQQVGLWSSNIFAKGSPHYCILLPSPFAHLHAI